MTLVTRTGSPNAAYSSLAATVPSAALMSAATLPLPSNAGKQFVVAELGLTRLDGHRGGGGLKESAHE